MRAIFYSRPESASIPLGLQPRLASWNAAAHPDQVRLREVLDDAATAVAPGLAGVTEPLALRLDVGLPTSVELLAQHDLDNYAYPLAAHLKTQLAHPLISVWCTKAYAATSSVRVEPAIPVRSPEPRTSMKVRTTASASTTAYKQQIYDQMTGASPLPEGAVALEIGFVVGPRRNWLNLWKPTIDALDRLLGRTSPDREWHPRDGRITEIGLHRTVDQALDNQVGLEIIARLAS
jgi:hypothetical protein